MQESSKENSPLRIRDSLEFFESAKENFSNNRFKASIDHSITACIAANDSFTILHLGKVASLSHYEAIDLHRAATKSFKENREISLRRLLDNRHRITYTVKIATKEQAERSLINAEEFIAWIKRNLNIK